MPARMEEPAAGKAPSNRRMQEIFVKVAIAAMIALPMAAIADDTQKPETEDDTVTAGVQPESPAVPPSAVQSAKPPRSMSFELQNFRPHDIKGLNVFEPPKSDAVAYDGKKLLLGFAFAQQFQGLNHSNTAQARMVTVNSLPVNANQLTEIGYGFNNASANIYVDGQLARGIRVALTGYLSSRHHQETWIKDGYLQIDASPIDKELLNQIMQYVTLRIGHFEINYGDAHFRRSDNGGAFFNPFVGNLLMDAFTTEIGAEGYARAGDFLAMAGVTGGEIRGQVQKPNERSPSYLAKAGFDRQLTPDARVRLTGSLYTNKKAVNSTLYTGSRAGSRYYSVLENTQATESAQAWSGDVQPGFRNKVTAWVVNPFVKYRGLELFGNIEQAKGRAFTEASQRTWNQYAGEGVYRFLGDKLYVGSRYNVAQGTLAGISEDLKVERIQTAGGWFLTDNVLMKGEYVRENYRNFPATDIRSGGSFKGFMVEGVVSF